MMFFGVLSGVLLIVVSRVFIVACVFSFGKCAMLLMVSNCITCGVFSRVCFVVAVSVGILRLIFYLIVCSIGVGDVMIVDKCMFCFGVDSVGVVMVVMMRGVRTMEEGVKLGSS